MLIKYAVMGQLPVMLTFRGGKCCPRFMLLLPFALIRRRTVLMDFFDPLVAAVGLGVGRLSEVHP